MIIFFSNLHPKVRVKIKHQREEIDFKVMIKIIEGKNLAGTQLDPVLDVYCFGEKITTATKEQTTNPYWDEVLDFIKKYICFCNPAGKIAKKKV